MRVQRQIGRRLRFYKTRPGDSLHAVAESEEDGGCRGLRQKIPKGKKQAWRETELGRDTHRCPRPVDEGPRGCRSSVSVEDRPRLEPGRGGHGHCTAPSTGDCSRRSV